MVRNIGTLCVAAAVLGLSGFPAQAGHMHQSPAMRKNQARMCPNGEPMHDTRSGRTVLYGCV